MQQHKVIRWAAVTGLAVGVLHNLQHPSASWWAGVLCGVIVGLLVLAFRAARRANTRLRY